MHTLYRNTSEILSRELEVHYYNSSCFPSVFLNCSQNKGKCLKYLRERNSPGRTPRAFPMPSGLCREHCCHSSAVCLKEAFQQIVLVLLNLSLFAQVLYSVHCTFWLVCKLCLFCWLALQLWPFHSAWCSISDVLTHLQHLLPFLWLLAISANSVHFLM